MLVCISIIVLVLFLAYFRKDVFADNKKVLLILLLIYLMVFATSRVIRYDIKYLYLIPVCLVPIIIRSFYDTRIALFVHIVTVIIIGFLVSNSFEFVFMQFIAGIISIVSISNLRKRSQFFITALLIFITYSAVYTGLSLIHEGNTESINKVNCAWFGISALLTLLTPPLIYIFERIFGFTTDISLIELSDTNTPLLRELLKKAPGTFHHSLEVANLVEDIITNIGGDRLLARAGALYHDVGKIETPMYFIENQPSGVNPHEDISYEESARIITGHVFKGIKIAKKHKLPEQVIDFIRTHHGTNKTQYFYTMFQKQHPLMIIDETMFTYHGPIPFSKETAVLMIADSVEAASRTLENPDEDSIKNLIDSIIEQHINNEQFNNANITYRDIAVVKKILEKQLMNIHHIRVHYPEL